LVPRFFDAAQNAREAVSAVYGKQRMIESGCSGLWARNIWGPVGARRLQQISPATVNAVGRFPSRQLVTRFPGGILDPPSVAFSEYLMAPRANWKGFLRLSLVTCPVALYPATSDTEKVSFNQINRKNRAFASNMPRSTPDTGEGSRRRRYHEGLQRSTPTPTIEVSKDETRRYRAGVDAHHRDRRVRAKTDIDSRYLIRPYYLVPDGKVGHDAFAVIRETTAA